MTSLPPVDDVLDLPHEINAKSLYTIILKAEHAAKTAELDKEPMYSRVLGYLILYPLGNVARAYVLKEIESCNELYGNSDGELNNALYELGKHYVHHLLRLFRKAGGRTPASSSHVSRPSFDQVRENIRQDLEHSPQNHSTAKAQALIRDGFRCMVTGAVDFHSIMKSTDLHRMCVDNSLQHALTQCCHIFPESTNEFAKGADDGSKKDYAATVWTILSQFGYPTLRKELSGALIHRLDNIMTLHVQVRDMMDTLNLWFEEVEGKENTYIVQIKFDDPEYDLGYIRTTLNIPSKVQFVVHSDQPLHLPNPQYLYIHAACCRIAHLSGAAKYLEDIFQDMGELPVLAEDGGSADVLVYALHQLGDPV